MNIESEVILSSEPEESGRRETEGSETVGSGGLVSSRSVCEV